MPMEPAQTVDVDRAVIHPDALQHAGGAGDSLAGEVGLVEQTEYVVHFLQGPCLSVVFFESFYRARPAGSWVGQPMVAVSEKSSMMLERTCRNSLFEVTRPG